MSDAAATRTVPKVCNLCEAMCGLHVSVRDGRVVGIRPDPDDPLSKGAMCAKAMALGEVQEDPDRLRRPLKKTGEGWVEVEWEEALALASDRLAALQREHGDDAVGFYLGNPGAHNFGIVMYLAGLGRALGTRNRYSASSLDQNPKHASSLLLFGNILNIPIPDVDHTEFMLMLGANPVVSNGSLMSAPGFRDRIRSLRRRGGRLVVVDPRRSETARLADEHIPIAPGRDALLLAALCHVILEEGLGRPTHLEEWVDGREALRQILAPFAPEALEDRLGLEAARVRALARRFCAAPSAVCYGRVGTCMNDFGTVASWLIDVLNLISGNLDRVGGALFPMPAVDLAEILELRGSPGHFGEARTRVRDLPTFNDERPTACLADEILEPGEGRLRGMITIAGNPCLSAPGSERMNDAFGKLDFYVAVDFYLNETTRHADLILPPLWSLEHDNHEVLFHGFAVRNTARYSPVVIAPPEDGREDWQILSQLALRIAEKKASGPLRAALLRAARDLVPTPRIVLDVCLRIGHYGDGFRPWRRGLRLRDLESAPSGIDMGPLGPRLDRMLRQRGRRIDLAPDRIVDELSRLAGASLPERPADGLLLIGRREPRTNNSWLHNVPSCARGRERCTLQVHPDDARRHGLAAGQPVEVTSERGTVVAPLEISEDMKPGVASLPHGFGHGQPDMQLGLASRIPGINCNILVDERTTEGMVANAVFNGVPIEIGAAPRPVEEALVQERQGAQAEPANEARQHPTEARSSTTTGICRSARS